MNSGHLRLLRQVLILAINVVFAAYNLLLIGGRSEEIAAVKLCKEIHVQPRFPLGSRLASGLCSSPTISP